MSGCVQRLRCGLRSTLSTKPNFTHQARLGWMSIWALNFAWFCEVYNTLLHGVGIAFLARQLTADPRIVVMASTVGLLFSGSVGPFINYLCDRIQTPLGRRRPFVVIAYLFSAVGLLVIPVMDSITTLIIAVAVHACIHAFASPLEPLSMELVPQSQQGRSQAIRNVFIQCSVFFFFQISLTQFDQTYPGSNDWFAPAGGVTGVHLAFWLGSGLLFLTALYYAFCTRETLPANFPAPAAQPRWWKLLKTFPKDVFADSRWWPVYGLYMAPGLTGGVWGNLRPLMVVEQFGYSMTEMARIGLPVSLAGLIVIAPLVGYCADRNVRYRLWQLLLGVAALLSLAYAGLQTLPSSPRELPDLLASLSFCLPLGLGCIGLLLTVVKLAGADSDRFGIRSRFIVISITGQILLAAVAFVWIQARPPGEAPMPMSVWLGYMTVSQCFGLTASVVLTPLLFSRIPSSKFGTVSSGFGIFNSLIGYVLGHIGGYWIHEWTKLTGRTSIQYSGLWILQALSATFALVIALRCLRSPLLANPPDLQESSSP